jgi:hypothetical protein
MLFGRLGYGGLHRFAPCRCERDATKLRLGTANKEGQRSDYCRDTTYVPTHFLQSARYRKVKSSIGRVLAAVWTRQLCTTVWYFRSRRPCERVPRFRHFTDVCVGELFLTFRAFTIQRGGGILGKIHHSVYPIQYSRFDFRFWN